jgi:hypothetical protein
MSMQDIMKLSNVTLATRIRDQLNAPVTEYRGQLNFTDAVWKLATTHPQWAFIVTDARVVLDGQAVRVNKFEVRYDDEKLGTIASEYYRGDNAVAITSRLIKHKISRGDTQYTKNAVTAVSIAKKMFAKRTQSEQLEEAWKAASMTFSNSDYRSGTDVKDTLAKINKTLCEFVFQQKMREFREYLQMLPSGATLTTTLDKYLEQKASYDVIKEVTTRFRAGNSCLVLMNDGIYTVQFKDKSPETYDDATLPMEYRGKIGLLKLVDDGQMVADNGCRISRNTFVLVF